MAFPILRSTRTGLALSHGGNKSVHQQRCMIVLVIDGQAIRCSRARAQITSISVMLAVAVSSLMPYMSHKGIHYAPACCVELV
jgi:hypothetical protein